MDWPEITKYIAFFLGGNQILCLLSGFYLGQMDFMPFCLHAGYPRTIDRYSFLSTILQVSYFIGFQFYRFPIFVYTLDI
jgi:hypothetical protein